MKKKIITATFAVAISAMVGYNTYLSHVEDGMSDMVLENVEALANDENLLPELGDLELNVTYQSMHISCFSYGGMETGKYRAISYARNDDKGDSVPHSHGCTDCNSN